MTPFHCPTRWRLDDPLAEFHAKLKRLEQTGDTSSPTIARLKDLVLRRIAELEASQAGTR